MCRRPSQKLKSPTTETERAAGAQTANDVPATPSISRTCAPIFDHSCSWRPSRKRCSSRSVSVGAKRYGSCVTNVAPSG